MIWLWIYSAGVIILFILGLLDQDADQPFIKNLQGMFNLKEDWGSWLGLIFWPLLLIIAIGLGLLLLACSLSFKHVEDYHG